MIRESTQQYVQPNYITDNKSLKLLSTSKLYKIE